MNYIIKLRQADLSRYKFYPFSRLLAVFILLVALQSLSLAFSSEASVTYCNPIDLPYRYALDPNHPTSYREAADPTVLFNDGVFWLFASKVGGYFHSKDLQNWKLITPTGFPIEDYAPSVRIIDGKWILITSIGCALYVSDDPASGKWTKLRDFHYIADPELFQDDDGRLYLYYGSSPDQPIFGVELDKNNNYEPIGQATSLIPGLDTLRHGWEARTQFGSDDEIRHEHKPWLEGAAMIKHNGVYYLQYSAPGTEMPEYADGIYTATKPLGPYKYAPYSPFSYKPTGFATSAGHGLTFTEQDGRAWRAVSMLIGVQHMFERRLGFFPAGFTVADKGDQIVCNTYLGDYPQLAPGLAINPLQDNLVGWMLLSLQKSATVSSTFSEQYTATKAFDEDMRTWWSAASGDAGEWLRVDFGKVCRINAVQINFADMNAKIRGFSQSAYKYIIEVSDDDINWSMLVDKRDNIRNAPHEYIQLINAKMARYARITNYHTPDNALFSLRGLRFFGNGLEQMPDKVTGIKAERQENRRLLNVSWNKVINAEFYVVRYGIHPDRLTLNRQIYNSESTVIPGLNIDQEYYVTIDAINNSGITKSNNVTHAK